MIELLFLLSGLTLVVLAAAQLWQGVQLFAPAPPSRRLNAVLESIAVLTVAVAALGLGQTILEEEVRDQAQMSAPTRVRRFLSRFMVVLVVALSIETLVLAFRMSHACTREYLPYVASIGVVAALLLAAWGVFIRLNRAAEAIEPDAMQAVKSEDRKIEKTAKETHDHDHHPPRPHQHSFQRSAARRYGVPRRRRGEEPGPGRQGPDQAGLDEIDRLLAKCGSNKSKVLSATIWVTDIRNRAPMNEVWTAWVDAKNLPARACVEAKLADPRALVEIMVIAAK